MDLPLNTFKRALHDGSTKVGIFVSAADPAAAELAAVSGFDWLIIDSEHAPNDLRTMMSQLQATYVYDVGVGVRPYEGDQALLKRMLDIGAQTVMIPMVDTAEQAAEVVSFTRYPPQGVRGVASARAARWTAVAGYHAKANDEICVIAQIETQVGLDNLDAIIAVEGVDAVFVGPSDLAASLGHLGNPKHPDVQSAVLDAIARISAAGMPAGVFASTPDAARLYADAGATLMLVGVDMYVLAKGLAALRDQFKD